MKNFIKKHDSGIITFFVVSFALVMFFLIIFARMAGEMGVSHETGQLVIYCGYIYITVAMLAPFAIFEI